MATAFFPQRGRPPLPAARLPSPCRSTLLDPEASRRGVIPPSVIVPKPAAARAPVSRAAVIRTVAPKAAAGRRAAPKAAAERRAARKAAAERRAVPKAAAGIRAARRAAARRKLTPKVVRTKAAR